MKLINKFKSKNFDKRNDAEILYIIIHYTAIGTLAESIKFLCDPKKRVSCHYLISQNGEIYSLVSEKNRAWHAGKSFWNSHVDINSMSIGIELDYSDNKKNNKFTKKMIRSLVNLLKVLKKKYKIKTENILGHSDIAPYRKIDPGENFTWNLLYKYKVAFKPKKKKQVESNQIKIWLKNMFKSRKNEIIFILGFIGYDTSLAKENNNLFEKLLANYQRRYLNHKKYGKIDEETIDFIRVHFINILLTK
tara:strand:- start:195 stop:938 length:744 start_codon:yes stop_codon:yes gene_type:complete